MLDAHVFGHAGAQVAKIVTCFRNGQQAPHCMAQYPVCYIVFNCQRVVSLLVVLSTCKIPHWLEHLFTHVYNTKNPL